MEEEARRRRPRVVEQSRVVCDGVGVLRDATDYDYTEPNGASAER